MNDKYYKKYLKYKNKYLKLKGGRQKGDPEIPLKLLEETYYTFNPLLRPRSTRGNKNLTYEDSQELCKKHHYMKNNKTKHDPKKTFYLDCLQTQCIKNKDLYDNLFIIRNGEAHGYRPDNFSVLFRGATDVKQRGTGRSREEQLRTAEVEFKKAKNDVDKEKKEKKKNDFECIQALQKVKHEAAFEPWDKKILCAASLEWEGEGDEKKLVWKCPTEKDVSKTLKSETPKSTKTHLYRLLGRK
jgi:hypothetical protein